MQAPLKMPQTERDIWQAIALLDSQDSFCVIEKVATSPQMGVKSAGTFMYGFGGLVMALTAARIPFERITPAKWQRALSCLTRGDKNVTKRKAQELFPQYKITHAVADAMLIAEYCRRIRG